MQGNIAVGVELADRGAKPFRVADRGDRIAGQSEELSLAQAGEGEDFHCDAVEQCRQRAGGG